MFSRYILLLFTLTLLISGCIPVPHIRQTKPELDGVLSMQGTPAVGVRVRTCINGFNLENCEQFKEVVTDRQGRFYFNGENEFKVFVPFLDDPLYDYGIEIFHAGRKLSLLYNGVGCAPEHVVLRCEITDKLFCEHEP